MGMFKPVDAQWWAGAVGSAIMAFSGAAAVPHPYDKFVMGLGAGLLAFCMFKIQPPAPKE